MNYACFNQPRSRTIYIVAYIIYCPQHPGITTNKLNASIQKLKSDFAGTMIDFVCNQIEYINNDTYCYLTESEFNALSALYDVDNKLNIYFVPNAVHAGMAFYKSNNCAITNGIADLKGYLSHEVGHCFYLYHTHGEGIEELVNGSNCQIAGDYLCDTPAEPYNDGYGIYGYVHENCNYFGTFRDANN